jgi:RNA ligase (TIGR02306 family)
MAELKVEVLKIEKIIQHPNADRLDLATVLGYQVVVGRDQYRAGDHAVYFPVDSILPGDLQAVIFAGSTMKLSKDRVRAARIRGCMSFGLLVDVPKIQTYLENLKVHPIRKGLADIGKLNLTSRLGVHKYEPPVKGSPQGPTQARAKKYQHPMFKKYTDIQHGKRVRHGWETQKGPMILTEKIHGTNFRCGWLPFVPRTRMQKFLKFLTKMTTWNFVPEYEFVYGSHNVQLQDGNPKPGAPAHDNVYERAVEKFNLQEICEPNELWFFEIAGKGIQTGYEYGHDDIFLRVIDIKVLAHEGGLIKTPVDTFLPWDWVQRKSTMRGLTAARTLWIGDSPTLDTLNNILNPPSMGGKAIRSIEDNQTPVEGGVLRPYKQEVVNHAGRLIYKFISDEYLLNKSNSDFH